MINKFNWYAIHVNSCDLWTSKSKNNIFFKQVYIRQFTCKCMTKDTSLTHITCLLTFRKLYIKWNTKFSHWLYPQMTWVKGNTFRCSFNNKSICTWLLNSCKTVPLRSWKSWDEGQFRCVFPRTVWTCYLHLFQCQFKLQEYVCLVVWSLSSHSRIFHSSGDVPIAGEGL